MPSWRRAALLVALLGFVPAALAALSGGPIAPELQKTVGGHGPSSHYNPVPSATKVNLPASGSHSLPYFFLSENKAICFTEEVFRPTLVAVHYKCPDLDFKTRMAKLKEHRDTSSIDPKRVFLSPFVGLEFKVNGPAGDIALPRAHQLQSGVTGSCSFVASIPGEYTICVMTNTSHWHALEKFQVYLQIEIDNDPEETSSPATARTHIEEIQKKVSGLLAMMHDIKNDQEYIKAREARFRQTSDSTYHRVWGFGLLQLLILVFSTAYQIFSLKTFLKAKKLV